MTAVLKQEQSDLPVLWPQRPNTISDWLVIAANSCITASCRRKKKEQAYFASLFHPRAARANRSRCARSVRAPPPRSARAPPLALREHHPSLCARCRIALREAQGCSGQGRGSLCARSRVALSEVQGRSGRGEGLRCARCRVALGEVQGRLVQVDTCEKRKCHRSQFCEKHFQHNWPAQRHKKVTKMSTQIMLFVPALDKQTSLAHVTQT